MSPPGGRGRGRGWGRGRRERLALLVVLVASVGLTGCRHSSAKTAGRLTVSGQAEILRPGEERQEVTTSSTVRAGDRVRVRDGTAEVRLADGGRLELRLGSDVQLQGTRPVLMGGDVLATSGTGPLSLGAKTADVSVTGVARASQDATLVVAAYQGSLVVTSGSQTMSVSALRQASIPAVGAFPARTAPLDYSPADTWDQRFLSDAIDLGNQLAGRSQGFSAQQTGPDSRTAAFFRTLFPQLAAEPTFDSSLVSPSRPPGETLVGAAITLLSTHGTFAERWAAVFGFHDAGAPWGLVALDQGVERAPLLDSIEAAIRRSPPTFAVGSPSTGGPTSLPNPSGGGSPATTVPRPSTTTTTVRPTPGAPSTTTTTVPPPTTVPLSPLNTGSPLIDDTVNSLVDTLSGLLRSLGQ